jgi:hypothetical protein
MPPTTETTFASVESAFFAERRHSCIVVAGMIQDHVTKPAGSKIPLRQVVGHLVGQTIAKMPSRHGWQGRTWFLVRPLLINKQRLIPCKASRLREVQPPEVRPILPQAAFGCSVASPFAPS